MNDKTIIDVRTVEEFRKGNAQGSINIPLQEIEQRIVEIRALPAPVVLCCAGGSRSGRAAAFLKGVGIECENGGGWKDLAHLS